MSDPGQPIHPFTIPAGIYGEVLSKEGEEYYVQFTLLTTSIYGYNWVYATIPASTFEPAELELADRNQDIPVIRIGNC